MKSSNWLNNKENTDYNVGSCIKAKDFHLTHVGLI